MSELPRTTRVLTEGLHHGYHSHAAVVVRHDKQILRATAGRQVTHHRDDAEPLYPLFCAAKPILNLAVAVVARQGLVSYDDYMETLIPGFGKNGKDTIKLRHILLHTSGFYEDPATSHIGKAWDHVIDAICDAKPHETWQPGVRACYQPFTDWYLLAQVLMNVTGLPLDRALRELVLDPLGLSDTWIGMKAHEYERHAERIVDLRSTSYEKIDELWLPFLPGKTSDAGISSQANCCTYGPYSAHGSLADLAKLYAMLIDLNEPQQLISRPARNDLMTRHRQGVTDELFGIIIDVGFGVWIESRMHGAECQRYGQRAGDNSFGHVGGFGLAGFGDPDMGVAAAYGADGSAGNLLNWQRTQDIFTAIYEDLDVPASRSLRALIT